MLKIAGRFPVAQENSTSARLLLVDPEHVLRVKIDGEMLGDAVAGIIPEEGRLRKKFKPVQGSEGADESSIALSGRQDKGTGPLRHGKVVVAIKLLRLHRSEREDNNKKE